MLGREPRISGAHRGQHSRLADAYRLLYGGIDSDGVTERARDITSVMAGVAKSHAAQVSCPVVMRDLYLVPEAERRLFAGIDRFVTPGLEFGASFEVKAGSGAERETFSLDGALTAGSKTVRLGFTNDYWEPTADRDIYLDRLDVRDAAGRVVASRELEEIEPSGNCDGAYDDHFALYCGGAAVDVPIDIPAAGRYEIEIVAWARHAGEGFSGLSVLVQDAEGSGAGADAIRNKLVELYDELLGVQVTPHSPDVESAFRLFVNAMERRREANDRWFEWYECDTALDLSYFEGILDDAVIEYEGDDGWRSYQFDWDRVGPFMDGVDFSDPHQTAQAWVVVLAYLMMDYRYLYL